MRALESVVDYVIKAITALLGISLGAAAVVLGWAAAIFLIYAFLYGLL